MPVSDKYLFSKLAGFHYNTALLEALDWDESQFKELTSHVSEYLEKACDKDLAVLLNNVELTWGVAAKKVLQSIFNYESFSMNLKPRDNNYEN